MAEMRRTLAERFERATVGVLHEEMRQRDQDAEMRKFQDGRTSLLVSTSMIERTVQVANATVMVITSAERFGMARLHQLRSRIGQGDHEGACYLVATPGRSPSPKAVERLTVVASSIAAWSWLRVICDFEPGAFWPAVSSGNGRAF